MDNRMLWAAIKIRFLRVILTVLSIMALGYAEKCFASSAFDLVKKVSCLNNAMRIGDLVARSSAVQSCATSAEVEQLGWLEQHWASDGDSFKSCGLRLRPSFSNETFNAASFFLPGIIDGNPFFKGQDRARTYMRENRLRMGDRRLCDELYRDYGPAGQRLPEVVVR